ICREVVARRAHLDPDHPDSMSAFFDLGDVLFKRGREAEAEPILRAVFERRHRALGATHASTLQTASLLGWLLMSRGDAAAAEGFYLQALNGERAVLGVDNMDTLIAMQGYGQTLALQGRYQEAIPILQESYERTQKALGSAHPSTLG